MKTKLKTQFYKKKRKTNTDVIEFATWTFVKISITKFKLWKEAMIQFLTLIIFWSLINVRMQLNKNTDVIAPSSALNTAIMTHRSFCSPSDFYILKEQTTSFVNTYVTI